MVSTGDCLLQCLQHIIMDLIDKVILCYPVITANPRYAHMDSLKNLLGSDVNTDKLEEVSIKHIHPPILPTFYYAFNDGSISSCRKVVCY